MKVSAWKGEVLGVRVGKPNREKHFSRDWTDIQIELDGKVGSVTLSSGFWRDALRYVAKRLRNGCSNMVLLHGRKGNRQSLN